MTDIIKKLINSRSDKPCLLISGYDGKPVKNKPYVVMYLINHNSPDIYMSDEEIKSDTEIKETMQYCGEFTYQFDVLGNTDKQAFEIAQKLKELITYKMRYQELELNGIGIVEEDYTLKALHEQLDSKEWIYKYSFDITFESYLTAERVTEIAKSIELNTNNKITDIGGNK